MKAVNKYLQQYAEPEAQLLAGHFNLWPPDRKFDSVLVIPVYDEPSDFLTKLRTQLAAANALGILVINRPDSSQSCGRNTALIKELQYASAPLMHTSTIRAFLAEPTDLGTLLIIDRDTQPIPEKQGVGLARKIGADCATVLWQYGVIKSPWLYSTDADAELPDNYFNAALPLQPDIAAGIFAFSHRNDGSPISQATLWYESHLRHYVHGLRRAGSPYGFYTLGSLLVINLLTYCQARGFPRRNAGEDFYLLNKLAKLGRIVDLEPCIQLTPRLSHRVPFGTGPATASILAQREEGIIPSSYHSGIFDRLAEFIAFAEKKLSAGGREPWRLKELGKDVEECLKSLGIEKLYQHLQNSDDAGWRKRHFHSWFDGFRTLKFVHYLQDHGYPPQPLPPPNIVQ